MDGVKFTRKLKAVKILHDKWARDFTEAAALALEEAGVDDMSSELTELFTSVIDSNRLRGEADKSIRSAIRERFGGKATWEKKYWFIPVPELGFDTKLIPQLTIMTHSYLVSAVEVETPDDFYSIVAVGAIGQPGVLTIPMVLLYAVLYDDLGRFRILARSGNRTTFEIPGATPVELPDEFLAKLRQTLERKSAASWLGGFGVQARRIIPLVVGALWGLQSMGTTQLIPTGDQPWSEDFILSALQSMVYTLTEAKDMLRRAAPYLRADLTKEEALRIVLQQAGKGE